MQKKIGIAIDAQNIVGAVIGDPLLSSFHNLYIVCLAIIRAIERRAQTMGTICWRVAGVAPPPSVVKGKRGTVVVSREVMQKTFENNGYAVVTVKHAKNAVDETLVRFTLGSMVHEPADACILATNDGEEPFTGFVNAAIKNGTEIYYACYNLTPERIKNHPQVKSFLFGGDARGEIEKTIADITQSRKKELCIPFPGTPGTEEKNTQKEKKKDLEEEFAHSTQQLARDTRTLCRLLAEGKSLDGQIPKISKRKIEETIRAFYRAYPLLNQERARHEPEEQSRMMRRVWQTYKTNGEDYLLTEEEIHTVLHALMFAGDLVDVRVMLRMNPESAFITFR